jgi:hypothetical protein
MSELDKFRVAGRLHGPEVYRKALKAAQDEIIELLRNRQEIDRRIAGLKRTIDGLTAVCDEIGMVLPPELALPPQATGTVELEGLTDSIVKVLQASNSQMTPTQVRDELERLGFNLGKYKQHMVPIHNTLKRLEAGGTVGSIKDERGRTVAYRWVSPIARALALEPPFN